MSAEARLRLARKVNATARLAAERQHVIDVFMWPTSSQEDASPKRAVLRGYNALIWTAGGLTYWAVSDLNAAEMGELQRLL